MLVPHQAAAAARSSSGRQFARRGGGRLSLTSVATQNHQKPLRSHSVVISKAGPSRAIFLNAARTENFHSRSLASSAKHFHFYVTFGSVKRTGKRWQPTQVDFEPSAVELGATVRHVCRRDTNVIRSL